MDNWQNEEILNEWGAYKQILQSFETCLGDEMVTFYRFIEESEGIEVGRCLASFSRENVILQAMEVFKEITDANNKTQDS